MNKYILFYITSEWDTSIYVDIEMKAFQQLSYCHNIYTYYK